MANQPPVFCDPTLHMEFVREFSAGEHVLTGSPTERREQIRVAIYRRNLLHAPFRDSGMDYGQAFERCYQRPIEMRHTPRPEVSAPTK